MNSLYISFLFSILVNVYANQFNFNITLYNISDFNNTNNTNNTPYELLYDNTHNNYNNEIENEYFGMSPDYNTNECFANNSQNLEYTYDCDCEKNSDVCMDNFVNDIFSEVIFNNISIFDQCNIRFNTSYMNKCIKCDTFSIQYNYNLVNNCEKKSLPVFYFVIGMVGVVVFIIVSIMCINNYRRRKYLSLNNNNNSYNYA